MPSFEPQQRASDRPHPSRNGLENFLETHKKTQAALFLFLWGILIWISTFLITWR